MNHPEMTAPTTEEKRKRERRTHFASADYMQSNVPRPDPRTVPDRRDPERERQQKELSPDVMDAWRWREYGPVLIAAAKAVVWFDWSGNDADAVSAMEKLRAAIAKADPLPKPAELPTIFKERK